MFIVTMSAGCDYKLARSTLLSVANYYFKLLLKLAWFCARLSAAFYIG